MRYNCLGQSGADLSLLTGDMGVARAALLGCRSMGWCRPGGGTVGRGGRVRRDPC